MEKNYTYQTGNKNVSKIIGIANLTIDGKNNIIDGRNSALAFEFNNSKVTLQNLIFQNCLTPVKIINGSSISTINVTFKNCSADGKYGGAVYAEGSDYTSTNDRFIDNYAESYGASLYVVDCVSCSVTNTVFSSQRHLNWGSVAVFQTLFGCTITNSTFENTKSKYATAIYSNGIVMLANSKFHNLSADLTGGAIAFKGSGLTRLQLNNCEFINVTSQKNGGAIFADIASDSESDSEYKGRVIIDNSNFINCSSEFGGALLQLGGQLRITNTTFTDNSAGMLGGAIYTSYTNATVNKAVFKNNKVNGSHGGAIYFDIGNLTLDSSKFSNNYAVNGGAITTYDSSYMISNSVFENKSSDKIYTFFDKSNSAVTNCSGVNATLNDTLIIVEVNEKGNPIIINRQKINGSASDSYFNLRDLGLVTDVRNQESMGACWAFGAAGAFESAFLIATGQKIDVSENNIQNLGLRYSIYGENDNIESGIFYTAANYFLDWFGAVNEVDDVYDELGKISPVIFADDAYHIVDVILVDNINKKGLKEALTTYGALDFDIFGDEFNSRYYNATYHSFYCNDSDEVPNHFVTLVGWDDNFDKNKFSIPAPGNGAWICKNSWGTDWGDEGYFYLSYYDLPSNREKVKAVGFVIENTENYDKLYQNSYQGPPLYNQYYDTYLVEFTSQNNDIIAGVGTYFENASTPYTIGIYINDTLVYTQNGKSSFEGFETIKLNQYIAVQPDCNFSVQIKSSSVPLIRPNTTRSHLLSTSHIVVENQKEKLDGIYTPVKVYAFTNNLTTQNIESYYGIRNNTFNISGPENAEVLIRFDGKNQTVRLENGTYTLDLGFLDVGTHAVNINYNNQSFTNYVFVKSTIDTYGLTRINVAYKSSLSMDIRFYDSNGNPLKNTIVSIKSAGKEIKNAKTDDNGTYNLRLNSQSKGTYYIGIVNPVNNESLRLTIKVVSRLSGNSNVNMYYYDGSTYKVRVKNDYGKYVGAGQSVTFKIGKKSYVVKTDKNGWAKLKIPSSVKPGKYTLKATYKSNTVSNKLTVKQTLSAKKLTVKKTAKKLVLKATLKKGKKPIKGKYITFKFSGKTYKVKTNSKGIAQKNLNKNVIKKLKKGKTYTVKVTYLKNTIKTYVKVK